MNNKIVYKWASSYDEAQPNNGFDEENQSIVTDGVYDFADYLQDNDVKFENENNIYFVIDEDGDRTGEAFMIVSEEPTDEELRG